MAQSISNFNAALKEIYLPRLQSTINTNRILMERLERDAGKTDISGRHARVPVNIRSSQAIGARDDADNNTLPTPQKQTFVEIQIGYKHNYGTIRVTHPAIMASKNDKGAFTRVMSAEMDGMRRDLKNDINRQLFGMGAGILGFTSNAGSTATAMTVDVNHKIKLGMKIDAYPTSAVGATRSITNKEVTAVAADGTGITVEAATWADNSIVCRAGNFHAEMEGLLALCDDVSKGDGIGTFRASNKFSGVNSSTYPEWNANVHENATANTARAITEALLDNAILQAQEEDEAEISLLISSATQFRKIGQLMTPDRRYTPTMKLEGGFDAIDWAGTPIVWDRDCPIDSNGNDMLFGIDESQIAIYELADWDWDDTDGDILHRVANQAAYDATLFYYAQLGAMDASKHFAIRDLSR